MPRTSIMDLLEAGVHFGHQTRRWNPKMKPYIFGTRNGITIFDLTITMRQLAEACTFLRDTVADGGKILFVGSKRQAQETVREAAERIGMFFMCDRWLGGSLTNNRVVLSRVNQMKKLQQMEADGVMATMPKKEVARARRELEKLERTLGGIAEMRKLPAALVVVDVGRETIAVREAAKLGIPVVGVVDSNSNPDAVDYVIPGNDDALRSIKVLMDTLAGAIVEGLQLSGNDIPAPPPEAPIAAVGEETVEAASVAEVAETPAAEAAAEFVVAEKTEATASVEAPPDMDGAESAAAVAADATGAAEKAAERTQE